ncbi:hypothetical protein BY996DRAFT_4579052 [Phakopsora pachyrhizi]|uniref:DUF7872 domain-containing protein n=1 Tax=Phakopsora pachyrhizi TaxID=170000 RepID=A0AAV0BFV2_PHAPC|nr:hypothetical protein BY996DRAFT_4579052 [Phakopsora pachyrhizi]CAH7686048.1 hypothetical protein PPACK8108_LOCUS20648 [Phakopsora pachyrhizi]
MSPNKKNNLGKIVLSSIILSFPGAISSFTANGGQIPLQSGCDPLPLTQETWNFLNMTDYLAEYPGGHNLSVKEYAAKLEVKNFKCGISQWCNAGQMCYPAKDLNWYALFAIQEWNERMNVFYMAIGYAITLIRSSLLSLISSLFPQPNNLKLFSQKVHFAMGGSIAGLIATTLLMIPPWLGLPSVTISWLAGITMIIAGGATFTSAFANFHDAPVDAFSAWSEIVYQITACQEKFQEKIQNETQTVLNSGISSPGGIGSIIRDGTFLDIKKFVSAEQIEANLRKETMRRSLSVMLKSMNAFVTVGSDPCTGRGKNGAWVGNDVLSYCSPNGTMFNVLTTSPKSHHSHQDIPNAKVLEPQFGITAEYITQNSFECHQNRTKITEAPPFNATQTSTMEVENMSCVIDLPVCDCRSLKFQQRKKKVGTVRACREAGVPI